MKLRDSLTAVATAFVLSVVGLVPTAASRAADDVIMVALDYGAAPTIAEGRIRGRDSIDYTFSGKAGQVLSASLTPQTVYFNLLPQGADEAIYIGSVEGNSYSGALPADGTYVVRVYQMGAAADGNTETKFELTLSLTGDATTPPPGFAGGDAGGPNFWAVTGLRTGAMLNMRSEPSANASIVHQISSGTRLRNLGCQGEGRARWCRVALVEGVQVEGWVSGRYLEESGPVAQ